MIDAELREHAESLYIVEGLTLEEVSGATGVNVRTIENWSAQEVWPEKKQEYRRALGEIKRNTVLLKKRLILKALESLDPQDVYAVSRLETATKQKGSNDREYLPGFKVRDIQTPEEAVAALQEAVERKINIMLARPGETSLSGVKDIKKAFELIDEMKKRYSVKPEETGKKEGLTKDNLKKIEEEILHLVR